MKFKLTEKRLIRLISCYTNVERSNIKKETRIREDLGLSSYDLACIASEIKEKYHINEEKDLLSIEGRSLTTIGDILSFLNPELFTHI